LRLGGVAGPTNASLPRETAVSIQSRSTTPGLAIATSANGVIRNRVSSARTVVEGVTHPVEMIGIRNVAGPNARVGFAPKFVS
jgi:hypothetical protein